MTDLGPLRWPEVSGRDAVVLAVPVGSCEQHGPHLPLDTDTRIAQALAAELAAVRPDVVVAPALTITASGEHAGFAGTLSIGTAALEAVVVELVRSADWAVGVVLVNGHGGNAVALASAAERLATEQRAVLVWSPGLPQGGDAHAGRTETSVILALAPELVAAERPRGEVAPLTELLDQLRRDGVAGVSDNGVLGDAHGASIEEGRQVLRSWSEALVSAFDTWRATLTS